MSIEPRNQNRMHVRKYYKTHRKEIILHKIERSIASVDACHACRPSWSTSCLG